MQIITLSGVDGSGKSTQLKLLKERLEREGKKAFYFHAIEFSLANRLARIFKGKKEFTPGEEKASVKASWTSLQLRKVFLLLDMLRFEHLTKKLAREGYDYILSDRYFYDSVINILYLSSDRNTSCFARLIPRPSYAFYFQITAEEIMKRERVPEQGIDYLKQKIALFERKKEAFGLISINASQSQALVAENLFRSLPS